MEFLKDSELEPETRFGEITAWRVWRTRVQFRDRYLLSSLVVPCPWQPSAIMSAELDEPFDDPYRSSYKYPPPRSKRVDFGLHAFRTKEQAKVEANSFYGFYRNRGKRHPGGLAIGQIKLWGTVIEHEGGYRGEHARIIGIALAHHINFSDFTERLKERYGALPPEAV